MKILVVEDDSINYQFIEALFEKTQVQLLHAENGTQALELCKTINKIDLILMDIKLPEKNETTAPANIEYFSISYPFFNLKYLFLFNFLEIKEIISCNVPIGQMLEQ